MYSPPSAINAILRDSCVDCLTSNDGGVIDFLVPLGGGGPVSAESAGHRPAAIGHHLLGAHRAVVVRQCHRLFKEQRRPATGTDHPGPSGGLRDPGRFGGCGCTGGSATPAAGRRRLSIDTTSSTSASPGASD